MIRELQGPFEKPRLWLLRYMSRARFKNELLTDALVADWTHISREKAAYILGTIWGRLRQMDNSLEQNSEYLRLMLEEFPDE